MILREGRSGALNYSAKEPNNWVEQEAGDCEFEDVRLGRRLVSLLASPEDDTTLMPSDFDVAITRSVPLIHDFDDFDPALSPTKTSGRRSEIRMSLDLDAHELIYGFKNRSSPGTGAFRIVLHVRSVGGGLAPLRQLGTACDMRLALVLRPGNVGLACGDLLSHALLFAQVRLFAHRLTS